MDSRAFYDRFVDQQLSVGVNARHRSIVDWLRRFGLARGDRVLEIGCGVGTVTGLLAEAVGPEGAVTGFDISPKSIEAAHARLEGIPNVDLHAADVVETGHEGRYDVVVLPDVIEHIPLDLHPTLFQRIAGWVEPDGFVLLHFPSPLYTEWLHQHRPDLLQEVDQPIHAGELMTNADARGLHLTYFETYSIWIEPGDYCVAVLRPRPETLHYAEAEAPPASLATRLKGLARRLIG